MVIPNRVIRYFYYLGYALGRCGRTQFPTFKNSLINFYSIYIQQKYYIKDPLYYPSVYGRN